MTEKNKLDYISGWNPESTTENQMNQAVVQTFAYKLSSSINVDMKDISDIMENIAFSDARSGTVSDTEQFLSRLIKTADREIDDVSKLMEECYYTENFDRDFYQTLAVNFFCHQLENDSAMEKLLLSMAKSPLNESLINTIGEYIKYNSNGYFDIVKYAYDFCIRNAENVPDYRNAAEQLSEIMHPYITTKQTHLSNTKYLEIMFYILAAVPAILYIGYAIPSIVVWIFVLVITCIGSAMGIYSRLYCKNGIATRRNFRKFHLESVYGSYRQYKNKKNCHNGRKIAISLMPALAVMLICSSMIYVVNYNDINGIELKHIEESYTGEDWDYHTWETLMKPDENTAIFYGDTISMNHYKDTDQLYIKTKNNNLVQDYVSYDGFSQLIISHPDDGKDYNNIQEKIYVKNSENPLYNKHSVGKILLFEPEYKIKTYIPYIPDYIGNDIEFTCYVYADDELVFTDNPEDFFYLYNEANPVFSTYYSDISIEELQRDSEMVIYRVKISNIPMDINNKYALRIKSGIAYNKEFPVIKSSAMSYDFSYPEDPEKARHPVFTDGNILDAQLAEDKTTYEIPRGGSFSLDLYAENADFFSQEDLQRINSKIEIRGFKADVIAVKDSADVEIIFENVKPESDEMYLKINEGAVINQYGFASPEQWFRLPISFNDDIVKKNNLKYEIENHRGFIEYNPIDAETIDELESFTFPVYITINRPFKINDIPEDVTDMVKITGLEYDSISFRKTETYPMKWWPLDEAGDSSGYKLEISLEIKGPFKVTDENNLYTELSPEFLKAVTGIDFENDVRVLTDQLVYRLNEEFPFSASIIEAEKVLKLLSPENVLLPKDGQPVHLIYQYNDFEELCSFLKSYDEMPDIRIDNYKNYYTVHDKDNKKIHIYVYVDKADVIKPYIGFIDKFILPEVHIS